MMNSKNDLARFKKFYRNPNQEDFNYFKKYYIKGRKFWEVEEALSSLMSNLDFENTANTNQIKIVENYIDFNSLHPLIQEMIVNYFNYIKTIK